MIIEELVEKLELKSLLENIEIGNKVGPRGIGDIIENVICDKIIEGQDLFGYMAAVSNSRRSIEDVKIIFSNQNYLVDIKTRDISAAHSMPNLISIDRIKNTYFNKHENNIVYIFIEYIYDHNLHIENIFALLLEDISFLSLSIQNLGKGQLQLTNAKKDIIRVEDRNRSNWLKELQERVIIFYDNLDRRTQKRKEIWSTYNF